MKILQVCNKSPYPPIEGGPIAMHAITQLFFENDCEVKVLAMNSNKFFATVDSLPEDYKKSTSIEWVDMDLSLNFFQALRCLLSNKSYHIERFISKDFERKIIEILSQHTYDIIWLESLYVAPYVDIIRKHSKAKIILRTHNIEHKIWERISLQSKPFYKKIYLRILSKQLKNYELKAAYKVDAIVSISDVDKAYLIDNQITTPMISIPFSIPFSQSNTDVQPIDTLNLFSLASMNWIPNVEGIQWFLDSVWNDIHMQHPDLKFLIAGRHIPDSLKNSTYPQVEIVGEVPDATEFMLSNGILIVPLLSGSGIRIKIIEAMSIGKVVITTSIGLEGIHASHKEHVLIANTASEFVDAVSYCLHNPNELQRIGKNAMEFIQIQHNNTHVAPKLMSFLRQIATT